jgi:antitoxin MazE
MALLCVFAARLATHKSCAPALTALLVPLDLSSQRTYNVFTEPEVKMSTVVKTRIVKIGNSHGIRIPKLLLEQVGLTGQVEIEAHPDQLVLRPVSEQPRQGWEEQFQAMAARGDDQLLDAELVSGSQWDKDEWEW